MGNFVRRACEREAHRSASEYAIEHLFAPARQHEGLNVQVPGHRLDVHTGPLRQPWRRELEGVTIRSNPARYAKTAVCGRFLHMRGTGYDRQKPESSMVVATAAPGGGKFDSRLVKSRLVASPRH